MVPAPAADVGLFPDFRAVLERLRRKLDVDFASLRLIEGDTLCLAGATGEAFPLLAGETAFASRALRALHPFVVPDAANDQRFSADSSVTGPSGMRFFAGIQLILASGQTIGLLSLFAANPRSPAAAARLAELAADLMVPRSAFATIAGLNARLAAQAGVIEAQAAALANAQKTFERAAATARIGVWECDLRTEALSWTDGVYDIFEFPRGASIDRPRTLRCYAPQSRALLETLRRRAVEHGTGFTLDAEITTVKGNRRWMRLTTSVELENGVAVRIFGMKQDITEEKILADRTRYLAEFDVMTGLANRSQFQSRLAAFESGGTAGALLLVDLDGFKQINDTFGHALGDECLKQTALRLTDVCDSAQLVARIGGDEFAVLLGPHIARDAIEATAAAIVAVLSQPVTCGDAELRFGASVGIAFGNGTPELFKQADAALYAAKAGGRNTFRVFGNP